MIDSAEKVNGAMRSRCLLAVAMTVGAGLAMAAELRPGMGQEEASLAAPATIVPHGRAEAEIPRARTNIRVDTDMVLVPVTVTDPQNRFVTGLDQDNFQVVEDKIGQRIVSFGNNDAPISIGIIFDTSGSMGNKLERSRLSVAEFFKTANPEDEAFLVEFNDRPSLAVPFTHNLEEIQNRLAFSQSKGHTALLDGLYLGLATMRKARNPRKALIIISDGGDNSSRYTESEVRNLVKEADVQIYAIGIYEAGGRGRTPEELSGPELLRDLAEPTGGRHFVVEDLTALPDVASKIGIELRNQYVIGYSPANQTRDGKYRKILVKIIQPRGIPQLRAFWRTGYFAPTQ